MAGQYAKAGAKRIFTTESIWRVTEEELIQGCIRQDRKAQQTLYELHAPLVMGICRRYLKSEQDAEDVLVEVMFKVLTRLQDFKSEGSFEGWVRRIAVNESLMFLRKNRLLDQVDALQDYDAPVQNPATADLGMREILEVLDALPHGYRTVFNLYVIEGYKHREIADLLGVSINTSKSQLALAKERMQVMLGRMGFGLWVVGFYFLLFT